MAEESDAEPAAVERRRRPLWLAVIAVAAAVVVVAVVAATRADEPDPCRAPNAAPPAERALLPAGLSFGRIGTITDVRRDQSQIMVKGVTTKPLDEVTVLIQDAVAAAGYRPAGMDNEVFEAEVFFTAGRYAAGQARVTQSYCAGRWDIDLVLLDRDATTG